MADFEPTIPLADVPVGESRSVIVDDTPILLVNVGGTIHAVEDACTHDAAPFDDGPIHDHELTCPRHGARFDVRTGEALSMPATEPVATFGVKVDDGMIHVNPEPGSESANQTSATPTAANTVLTPLAEPKPAAAESTSAESGSESDASEESELIGALKEVIDPELMINIVDLGLVYEIDLDGRKANVQMTLTSPACPAGPQIISQAQAALERLETVDDAEIQLVMSPPWTPERMTDDARDQLGIF